jgi:hypothetical protein
MDGCVVRIAEHHWCFRTDSAWIREQLHRTFGLARIDASDAASADMTVELADGYGTPFAGYEVKTSSSATRISFTRADYRIEAGRELSAARLLVHDGFALKHALMNLYSAFITHREWGLLIHSSCVEEEGRAYLFAGPSGAGKSTAARLSAPRRVLSDEASIVKVSQEGVTVFDSPFRSDSDALHRPGSYPLAGVHFLKQSREDRIVPVGKLAGVLAAADKIFYWPYDPLETLKVWSLCQRLGRQVPCYDLYFRKSNAFWSLLREEHGGGALAHRRDAEILPL